MKTAGFQHRLDFRRMQKQTMEELKIRTPGFKSTVSIPQKSSRTISNSRTGNNSIRPSTRPQISTQTIGRRTREVSAETKNKIKKAISEINKSNPDLLNDKR